MSTVEAPATKTKLVMFDDEMKSLQFSDDEQQIIYSVAMRPNMLIPRKDINGEPAMVFYSENTVSDLQQNFFKNNSHNGATINHDKNVRNDIYAFESWIVTNPEKDKATEMGLEVQKGDWVLGQKVDNPEVWQKIKNKELMGFSIEAYLEPVLIKNEIEMTQEELEAGIKKVLMEIEQEKNEITPPSEPTPPSMDWEKKVADLEAENNDLKAKLKDYEEKETTMSAEIIEMKAEIEKGVKPVAMQKKYEEMSNAEKAKFNRGLI